MATYVSRWGEHGERPAPRAENGTLFGSFTLTESISVRYSPAAAWELITDIGRIGEFSSECIGAQWIAGATGPAVGARFEGTNRLRLGEEEFIWIGPCTVTAHVPGERFAYVVGDRFDGTAATEWEWRLDAVPGGCRISQTFRHRADGLSGIRA
jgi:polyketide cyclase/dehydrase/lipid transport protein